MNAAPPDLSIVIPAFNEERRLGNGLETITQYLATVGRQEEIIVADDGSTDGTAHIIEEWSERGVVHVRLPRNRGKGAACRAGVARSRGLRVLITDADLSTPIDEVEKLEAALGPAAIVLGSRAVDGAEISLRQPLHRVLMGKTFNRIIQLLGVRGVHDTQCGFKLMEGPIARSLFAEMITDGFAFDVELVWLARQHGHPIAEVGVRWRNSPDSRVDRLRDPARMIRDILRFRRHHRR